MKDEALVLIIKSRESAVSKVRSTVQRKINPQLILSKARELNNPIPTSSEPISTISSSPLYINLYTESFIEKLAQIDPYKASNTSSGPANHIISIWLYTPVSQQSISSTTDISLERATVLSHLAYHSLNGLCTRDIKLVNNIRNPNNLHPDTNTDAYLYIGGGSSNPNLHSTYSNNPNNIVNIEVGSSPVDKYNPSKNNPDSKPSIISDTRGTAIAYSDYYPSLVTSYYRDGIKYSGPNPIELIKTMTKLSYSIN